MLYRTESSARVQSYAIFVETFDRLAQSINIISYSNIFYNETVVLKENNGIDEEELLDKSFHLLDKLDNIKSITKENRKKLFGKIKFLGKLFVIFIREGFKKRKVIFIT